LKITRIFKNKKAVSATIATVMMLGITIIGVAAVFGFMSANQSFNAKIDEGGAIYAVDYDRDGLIDSITLSLINKGMDDAKIESIIVVQNGIDHLWYSFDTEVEISSYAEINVYALSAAEQIEPLTAFHVEITFDNEIYTSPGYSAALASEIPEEVIPGIGEVVEDDGFEGYDLLVRRTSEDDHYARWRFPTDAGYSPTMWFVLGEFDDNNKRADVNTDFIDLCGHGSELDFSPYLLDNREFVDGDIGVQSGNKVMAYEDAGDHPGLVALDKYGNWDKGDDLNWGKRGVVYMWSYIYVTGTEDLTVSLGANGASEYKVWLNGELTVEGTKKNRWSTADDLTLHAGLNLVMMKISAKTNAHFAGQVLFFNNAQLANTYSVWPTLGDL